MAQRIILIHGRSTKPCKKDHAKLLERALLQGLNRVDPEKAAKVANGTVPVDYVYYGDVNNSIMAQTSQKIRDELTATDPDAESSPNAPCLPSDGYAEAIDDLKRFRTFNKRAYKTVIRENDSQTWLDNLARLASTVSALATATLLNEVVIKYATEDLAAYLMQRTIGSRIRERLHTPLKTALINGDDVCLVAHSMGTMVSYDVLWKFSRMSEYKDVQMAQNPVSLFLTLGAPLGEAGVKANLYDADERNHRDGTDKFPKDIIKSWHNIAAHDDFISHDPSLKDDFRPMLKFNYVDEIVDHRIYNCWAFRGEANPHKFYGYLANPKTAGLIADWMD
ncbi:MAG: hypothetical protein AAFO72_13670 [Pseudomonadota bacterium]